MNDKNKLNDESTNQKPTAVIFNDNDNTVNTFNPKNEDNLKNDNMMFESILGKQEQSVFGSAVKDNCLISLCSSSKQGSFMDFEKSSGKPKIRKDKQGSR